MLNDLLNIGLNNFLSGYCIGRLKDFKQSNSTAHNSNIDTRNEDYKAIAELCKAQSLELTKYLFSKFDESMPLDLSNAYDGIINQDIIASINSSKWEDFHSYVDEFSRHCKYVLISPPEYENCTKDQLNILSRLPWSFIVDFNVSSKSQGLYYSFIPEIENKITPITINQLNQKNIVSSGINGNINWLFASGIDGDPNSISNSYKNWRTKKYPSLIKQTFSEFTSTSLDRICIVIMDNDYNYIDEMIRIICDIDTLPSDLAKIAVVSDKQTLLDRECDITEKYDVNCNFFNISITEFISRTAASYKSKQGTNTAKLIPARVDSNDNGSIDISSIYNVLQNAGINVVYQDIDSIIENDSEKPISVPKYYSGEHISWSELSQGVDVIRNKYDEIKTKILEYLNNSKVSLKFELQHFPGAGGTTISRRLAYDIRRKFPVALITKYKQNTTLESLLNLVYKTNKPTVVFIEASSTNTNELDELIRGCNSQKQVVVFVYIIRTFNRIKDKDKVVLLSDKMLDNQEQNSFISKVKTYSKNSELITELSELATVDSEVINYALAISDGYYKKDRIDEYLSGYINHLPEPQVKFIAFVSLIYYYSQKKTSEYLFRSLFQRSLTEDLRHIAISNRYINKILIQEQSESGLTEYWRPRFYVFAESILRILLNNRNNWKEHILQYSLELIKIIKINNPYLVDETREILKGVFLERKNEDLLGKDDEWNSITNDQFSIILNDIKNLADKKSILIQLTESYPEEAHFWGHLARFVYENASRSEEFDEAMSYIQKSFDSEGVNDYNLHHIAGMCRRRQIEYFKRNDDEIPEEKLIELTNDANYHFSFSRELNHKNIHAYISQIQLIVAVLEYGKRLSKINDFTLFITSSKNEWYLEQYNSLSLLIDEAKMLVEQLETLGKTKRTEKAKKYLVQSEGHSSNVIGNFYDAIELFRKLIDTSERDARPKLRMMYIRSVLLSKVNGDNSRLKDAWILLKPNEIDSIDKYITDNILHDISDVYTLRLWFQFIRYSTKKTSIEEIKSRLKMLYQNCNEESLMKLESSYYLYIVNTLLLLKSSSGINVSLINETKKLISEAKALSFNDKFPFEWLMSYDSIGGVINFKDKRNISDDKLVIVNGMINKITSRQQGLITMPCGLTAFFTPAFGDFISGKDETTDVKFNLAFRHDGLVAYNVKRISDIDNENMQISTCDEIEEVEEPEPIQKASSETTEDETQDTPITLGIKVVGKIDLSQFEKYKKK